jgi:deazaflavin-dependent oxidoreductase (nitroreductase family)
VTSTEYVPSPQQWVRDQVETFEGSDGAQANTMRGRPIVVLTMRGAKSGNIRKVPLMRVEHGGAYLAVASVGGAPKNPVWVHNVRAEPRLALQDGADLFEVVARELAPGEERDTWWARAVEAFPLYADYQRRTDRLIPLFLLERV